MTQAAKLLQQHSLTIKEIAHLCGYEDVSNFYRDFKRVHGMTPQSLRLRQLEVLCQSQESVHIGINPL